jgi:hypothetical protein
MRERNRSGVHKKVSVTGDGSVGSKNTGLTLLAVGSLTDGDGCNPSGTAMMTEHHAKPVAVDGSPAYSVEGANRLAADACLRRRVIDQQLLAGNQEI